MVGKCMFSRFDGMNETCLPIHGMYIRYNATCSIFMMAKAPAYPNATYRAAHACIWRTRSLLMLAAALGLPP